MLYDEQPDKGLREFYSSTESPVSDRQNAAIALMGLSAPSGTDFIGFGRFVADTVAREDINWAQAKNAIEARGVLTLSKQQEDLDCLNWPEPDYSSARCPTAKNLAMLLKDNAELLSRYRQLYSLPGYQPPRFGYNGQLSIEINKLIAEEIAFELDKGNSEIAYQEWQDNYIFLERAIQVEDSWVGKAILMVNEGISLGSIEQLLYKAPSLIERHGDELINLLSSEGLSRWNIKGVMRAEYRLFEPIIEGNNLKFWVHPNFIRNRFFRAGQAFLEASSGPPVDLDRNFRLAFEAHANLNVWSWDYALSPLNAAFVRSMLGGQLKAGTLVSAMLAHDGRMRLLILKILLTRNHIPESKMNEYLSEQPETLKNPFTNAAMRWGEKNKVICFCSPNSSTSCPVVRLSGGKWLDEPWKECADPKKRSSTS